MSDIREQLMAELDRWNCSRLTQAGLADAILERFDVTPKPVIDNSQLGRIAQDSLVNQHQLSEVGLQVVARLAANGLKIVKADGQ